MGRPPTVLSSTKNTRVRETLRLREAKVRRERQEFTLEGAREIRRALKCGYHLRELYVCPELLSTESTLIVGDVSTDVGVRHYQVSEAVFQRLAVREGRDGIVAVLAQKTHLISNLKLPPSPLILAVEGVEKPGNLGALLRSADGAGVDAVVVLEGSVDLYNPNTLRASVGSFFHVPLAQSDNRSFLKVCRDMGLVILAASPSSIAIDYDQVSMTGGTVLLLGSEAYGISSFWLDQADQQVRIPMEGMADSLNVSVAGAVLAFEARRQRRRLE